MASHRRRIKPISNLRKLSHITLLLLTVIFFASAYDRASNIRQHYQRENENYARLIANASRSYFQQANMILDLLGNQLLNNENYKKRDNARQVFQRMLQLNSSIIGYALMTPQGDFLLSQLEDLKLPEDLTNILQIPQAKESFLQAVEQKQMVIGRTYLLPISKRWVIPVRKPFLNQNGDVIAVLSLTIDLNNPNIFDTSILSEDVSMIHLLRADDYRQLYLQNIPELTHEKAYNQPVSEAFLKVLRKEHQQQSYGLKKNRDNNSILTYTYRDSLHDRSFMASSQYLPELQLWVGVFVDTSAVRTAVLSDIAKILAGYVLAACLLIVMFRQLERSEEQKQQKLIYQASHDSLTGLPNRRHLLGHIRKQHNGQPIHYVLFCIDNLKTIVDTYGYTLAEDFICRFAQRLKVQEPEPQYWITQLANNEFLLVCKVIRNTSELLALKQRLEQSLICKGVRINFTVSIGVSRYPQDAKEPEALIRYADMALQESRHERGRVTFFTRDTEAAYIRKLQIENKIPQAISKGEFSILLQPQIAYPDALHGVEVLARWHNDKLGTISPAEFVSIAEHSGLMPALGEHIIERACYELSELRQRTGFKLRASLNISAKQFMHDNFMPHLMATMTQYGLPAHDITLELTESIFIHDVHYLGNLLQQLRTEGFKISMDDFGTGFSSLSMLRKIPLNELKIDKSFVDDITEDKSAEHVIQTIILISNQLQYDCIIAEGTETQQQVDLLLALGCHLFQGYFFAKPMTAAQLESQWLKSQHVPIRK